MVLAAAITERIGPRPEQRRRHRNHHRPARAPGCNSAVRTEEASGCRRATSASISRRGRHRSRARPTTRRRARPNRSRHGGRRRRF
jgi:hypothetical protein